MKTIPAGIVELDDLARANRNNPERVNSNLMKLLCNVDVLKAAFSYGEIKSNPGNMTQGSDSETLDGINDE